MSTFQPFTPGANFSISVTTTTGNVAITGAGTTLRLANVSAVECFVATGVGSGVAATTAGFSVPGNSQVLITVPSATTYLAAITAATTTTLRISRGDGGV